MTIKKGLDELRELEDAGKDIHKHPEQIKRQAKARTCKILELDKKSKVATFRGSGGKIYEATLMECSCRDFILRRYPCKHMYRLASEVGEFDITNIPSALTPEEEQLDGLKQNMKGLSRKCVRELADLLHDRRYRYVRIWTYKKNNSSIHTLIEKGFLRDNGVKPELFLLAPMKDLRDSIKKLGLRCPRKKIEAAVFACEKCPQVGHSYKQKYVVVSLSDEAERVYNKLRLFSNELLSKYRSR